MEQLNNPAHDSASAMANARWQGGGLRDLPTQAHLTSHARILAQLRWGAASDGTALNTKPDAHQSAAATPAIGGALPWLALAGSGLAFILAGMERKQSEGGEISGTAVFLYIVAAVLFGLAVYLFLRR